MKLKNFILAALCAVAALSQTSHAALQATLPEFKSKQDLRASSRQGNKEEASGSAFYTGKPFEAAREGYLFNYRSYDSELNRWTSIDPSGFPDGANNQSYAPTPTNDFDYQGLLKWSTLTDTHTTATWSHAGNTLTSEVWTVKTDDESATITLWKNTTGGQPGQNYAYNCHGYTFGNSQYWINGQVDDILKGDGYKLITGTDKAKAKVAYWGSDIHTAQVTKVESGSVTEVTGKLGAAGMQTSAPANQAGGAYGTNISYYE